MNITKIDRDELIKYIFDELVKRNEGRSDDYDVDAFYTDIVNVRWDKIFIIDDDFQVDFGCATIKFIISDTHFDIADKVIITSELFCYSNRYFGEDREKGTDTDTDTDTDIKEEADS